MKQPYRVVETDDGYLEVVPKHPDEDAPPTYGTMTDALEECARRNLEHHVSKNAPVLMDLYAAFQCDTFYGHLQAKRIVVDTLVCINRRPTRYTHNFTLAHTLQYYLDRGLIERCPGVMSCTLRLTRGAAYLVSTMRWGNSPVAQAFRAWTATVAP